MVFKVDFCNYNAAKFAATHWHYSGSLPASKRIFFGLWEDLEFMGAIIFSWGANRYLGRPYNLKMIECAELCRIAFSNKHKTPVSQALSKAITLLKQHSSKLRLLISYADLDQGHIGSIYQASNWVYSGRIQNDGSKSRWLLFGESVHSRTVYSRYKTNDVGELLLIDPAFRALDTKGKHKYLYPLDRAMRKQIEPLRQPYPKRQHAGG